MNRVFPWLLLSLTPLLGLFGCGSSSNKVVVYSAQDQEYAEALFTEFEQASSLRISPKFDMEANKSVSLAVELEEEVKRPRCDVHWNNEILGTIRLARQGIYAPYASPSAAQFPAFTRSKDGTWQAFAERARVLIVNTKLLPKHEYPDSILDLVQSEWRGKIAMAKPQFGTTATQAACLFEVLGDDAARSFYHGLRGNQVALLPGNKSVARAVADGQYAIGFTDSDDAVLEVIDGKPVEILFPDSAGSKIYPRLGTLFIPNTLAVVKGSPNPEGAKALVDFLLKQESKLASGGGYQYPVAPDKTGSPHPALKARKDVIRMATDFDRAADKWELVQEFLRIEFAR